MRSTPYFILYMDDYQLAGNRYWLRNTRGDFYGFEKESGFTLIEVLVVITIMLLVMTITITSMSGSLKNIILRTETKKLSAALRFTRNLAVTHGVAFELQISPDGRSYRVAPSNIGNSKVTNVQGKLAQRLMKGVQLDKNVLINFEGGEAFARKDQDEDAPYLIVFYSKGNTSGGFLSITHIISGRRYILDVVPITGRIKIEGPYGKHN